MADSPKNEHGSGAAKWLPTLISVNGVLLTWYEAIFNNFDRPWLLALAGGMMGILPAQLLDKILTEWRKG